MNESAVVGSAPFEGHIYPAEDLAELRCFIEGDQIDPKKQFRLADDVWPAWRYAENGRTSTSNKYHISFAHLGSFLKPYVKHYLYSVLLSGAFTSGRTSLPYNLSQADRFITNNHHTSLDDLYSPEAFESLWNAQITGREENHSQEVHLTHADVWRQEKTRPFWLHLSAHFGSPRVVPPVSPYEKRTPADYGADESKVIPAAVIRQLANILGLHRDGVTVLIRFYHLRLCVLLLVIALGRRIDEVLGSGRGKGPDGPLEYYPCKGADGELGQALWFRFLPNKGGTAEWAYISPQWEDLVLYCVRQLIRYSDEVREFAAPEERDLLILTSRWNLTAGNWATNFLSKLVREPQEFTASGMPVGLSEQRLNQRLRSMKRSAIGLKYESLHYWLTGSTTRKTKNRGDEWRGVMHEWNITSDGTVDGPIYTMSTNYGRHTRQTALACDRKIPPLTRQHDLNHKTFDEQFVYQHVLKEENEALLKKIMEVSVIGQSGAWFYELLGIKADESGLGESSQYRRGLVSLITPRFQKLLESNREYVERNIVDEGVCGTASGPDGCVEYQRAVGAKGKKGSVSRSKNNVSKAARRQKEQSSGSVKKQSLAQPQAVKGDRSETLLSASSGIVSQLGKRQREIKESGYGNTNE
jgi:hypothetical protein